MIIILVGITMPANMAAHVATHLGISSRMQRMAQIQAAAGLAVQRQTGKDRITSQLPPIPTAAVLASRHPLTMPTILVAKRLQSGVIIDNIGGVVATVLLKTLVWIFLMFKMVKSRLVQNSRSETIETSQRRRDLSLWEILWNL